MIWFKHRKTCAIELNVYYPLQESWQLVISGDQKAWQPWSPLTLSETSSLPNGLGMGQYWQWQGILHTPFKGNYRYGIRHLHSGEIEWERGVARTLLPPPRDMSWQIEDRNLILGALELTPVNQQLYYGPYLQNEQDIAILKRHGIDAVISLQTQQDHQHRAIDSFYLHCLYQRHNIDYYHLPITDFDYDDLAKKLVNHTEQLEQLISQDRRVYVHCTAGISRAPSLVIAYLQRKTHQPVLTIFQQLKAQRPIIAPNIHRLQTILGQD